MIRIIPCRLTVDHEELAGSPKESVSDELGGVRVVRSIKCAWADRHTLAQQFLGYRKIFGRNVVEYAPHTWTQICNTLIVTAVSIEPWSPRMKADLADTRFAEYDSAELTVTYTIPQVRESEAYGGQVRIQERFQGASEFITLPEKNLYWGLGEGKEAIDNLDAPGKISQITEWIYSISGARQLPSGLTSFPGKINLKDTTSASTGLIFPYETLLCGNPAMSREERFDGYVYNLTLRFLYKNNGTFAVPKGWNYFPRTSKTGGPISWELLSDGTNYKDIYDPVDFGPIMV